MGSAIYTGVTGLQVHQRKIDVIAANIANVNTTGYRGSRALFQDLFSQTLQGPSAPIGNFGGRNGSQVGLGARLGVIDINFTQGTLLNTGVASDLAIQGNGFFVLSGGSGDYYTRDGSFTINANGELVDAATGLFVQGFQADANGVIDPNTALTNISIPVGTTSIVRATTDVSLVGNLNSGVAAGDTVVRNVQVFDSLGTPRDIQITFTKSATTNEWDWAATSTDPDINTVTGAGTIAFDTNGSVMSGGIGNVSITFVAGIPAAPDRSFRVRLRLQQRQPARRRERHLYQQPGWISTRDARVLQHRRQWRLKRRFLERPDPGARASRPGDLRQQRRAGPRGQQPVPGKPRLGHCPGGYPGIGWSRPGIRRGAGRLERRSWHGVQQSDRHPARLPSQCPDDHDCRYAAPRNGQPGPVAGRANLIGPN